MELCTYVAEGQGYENEITVTHTVVSMNKHLGKILAESTATSSPHSTISNAENESEGGDE